MKKIITLLIVLSLAVMVSSCGLNTTSEDKKADNDSSKTENVKDNSGKTEKVEQSSTKTKKDENNQGEKQEDIDYTKLVEEYVSEELAKKDGELEFKYSFSLPKIMDESEDADKINAIIEDRYGKEIKKILKLSDIEEAKYYDVSWKTYWSGNIVSIVINALLNAEEEEEILALTYNFETKQSMENADILKYVGLEEDEFSSLAKKEIIKKFDSAVMLNGYDYEYEDLDLIYKLYLPLRSYILSNFSNNDLQLYLENDSLKMIAQLYDPEVPGAFYCYNSIEVDKNKKYPKKEINDDYLKVRLEENRVFVSLEPTLISDGYFTELTESDINKEYEVEGLYGDYKDIRIGVIGQDYYPILILTKEDGSLEMVNVFGCVGSRKFVSMPVLGLFGVNELYDDIVETDFVSYRTIGAKDSSSNSYDLSLWLYASAFSFTGDFVSRDPDSPYVTVKSGEVVHSTESGGEYTSTYELKISEIEIIVNDIVSEVGVSVDTLLENLNCLGMNDEGMCYNYWMFVEGDDGTEDIKNGCFALRYSTEFLNEIEVKVLHGTELFDSPDKWIKFSF